MRAEIWNLKGNCSRKIKQVLQFESLSFWELESFKGERSKQKGSEEKEDKLFHGHSQGLMGMGEKRWGPRGSGRSRVLPGWPGFSLNSADLFSPLSLTILKYNCKSIIWGD